MKVLPLLCVAVVGTMLAAGIHGAADAGSKIIHVKVGTGAGAVKFKGPRILRHGRYHRPRWRHICCVDLDDRSAYPYFYAPQPWHERNYLRGPDFPPVNNRIQSVFEPSRTIPNENNIYRQRFGGGRTVRQGSIWAGSFTGGRTVRQGSPWRSRIDY